jgi:hypothetical protein
VHSGERFEVATGDDLKRINEVNLYVRFASPYNSPLAFIPPSPKSRSVIPNPNKRHLPQTGQTCYRRRGRRPRPRDRTCLSIPAGALVDSSPSGHPLRFLGPVVFLICCGACPWTSSIPGSYNIIAAAHAHGHRGFRGRYQDHAPVAGKGNSSRSQWRSVRAQA